MMLVARPNPATDTTVENWYAPGTDVTNLSAANPLRTITTITDAQGNVISVTEMGYPSTGTSENPVWQTLSTWTATYDDLGELLTSTESNYVGGPTGGTMSPPQTLTYTYTPDGVESSISLSLAGTSTISATYTVNSLDQTTSVTQTTTNGNTDQAAVTYLADGRINTITRSGGTGGSSSTATTVGGGPWGHCTFVRHC